MVQVVKSSHFCVVRQSDCCSTPVLLLRPVLLDSKVVRVATTGTIRLTRVGVRFGGAGAGAKAGAGAGADGSTSYGS